MAWLTIDGSAGEGGGQILRTALALSLVTARPFRIENIRAGRSKPGLLRQHLTAVQAATTVGRAEVSGAELGSRALSFAPSTVEADSYSFTVGTAGSATLVCQTILPALLCARASSRVTFGGGTHNPAAPPFDFLAKTLLPLLRRMGARIEARLEAYGFYPAGGGRFAIEVEPCSRLNALTLLTRGPARVHARAIVSSLPETIGTRELTVIRERLQLDRPMCHVETVHDGIGPGNVVMIAIDSESVTEIVTGFGIKGVAAETVAADACTEAERYLSVDVPVGIHLADQLLIPLALAGGGSFRTLAPTAHTTTNAAVIEQFMDVAIRVDEESAAVFRVTVSDGVRGKV